MSRLRYWGLLSIVCQGKAKKTQILFAFSLNIYPKLFINSEFTDPKRKSLKNVLIQNSYYWSLFHVLHLYSKLGKLLGFFVFWFVCFCILDNNYQIILFYVKWLNENINLLIFHPLIEICHIVHNSFLILISHQNRI